MLWTDGGKIHLKYAVYSTIIELTPLVHYTFKRLVPTFITSCTLQNKMQTKGNWSTVLNNSGLLFVKREEMVYRHLSALIYQRDPL